MFSGQTKFNIVMPRTKIARDVLSAMSCGQRACGGVLAGFPCGADVRLGEIFPVIRAIVGTRARGIADPLPTVFGQIEHSVGSGALRIAHDIAETIPSGTEMGMRCVRPLTPSRKFQLIESVRYPFPFRFCR